MLVPTNESKLFYLTVGNNIKKYRTIRNYSLQDLAERVGLTKKTIQRYENGEIKINMERLPEIATALEVGMDTLLDGAYELLGVNLSEVQMINLPVVGRVSCGNGTLAYEEIEKYEPTPASWLNGGEYFYSRVVGDSMINARIYDGDLVLIRRQPDVEDGEIAALVAFDGTDGQVFLKRVYKRNGTIVLQSENPAYPPMICDSKCADYRIIGKLKKIVINV